MTVWMYNHYAAITYKDKAGRHYSFANELIHRGYDAKVFCASTYHLSDDVEPTPEGLYGESKANDVPYVFIKAPKYSGNGKSRIINMLVFAKNMFPVSKALAKKYGKPDVIIASSVHPFTCVAGERIAKKFGIPCIVEIRDLWPESIVAFTDRSENNIAVKALYKMEKYIYKKADKIIFTMEGGPAYIKDKHWSTEQGGPIDLNKVYYINNGIDIESYDNNIKEHEYCDEDIDSEDFFKVVYAGSIRPANNVKRLVDAASHIDNKKVKLLIFGDGDDKAPLEAYCKENKIENVIFKGFVDRCYVPSILTKSNLNILNYQKAATWRYGGSQNKLFEYLASGKPICANVDIAYSPIKTSSCGISENLDTPEQYAEAIQTIAELSQDEYKNMCENARECAISYDYKKLTDMLIEVLK